MRDLINRDRLLQFLGFGNPRAEVVFLGMEEGLTVPPSLEDQLAVRSRYEPMMDLGGSAKAYPEKYLSGDHPPIQPTWNLMIRVLLAIEGRPLPASTDQEREALIDLTLEEAPA